MRNTISLFFLFFLPYFSGAQDIYQSDSVRLIPDSTMYEVRAYNQEKLDQFRADEEFDYIVRAAPGKTLPERFVDLLSRLWKALFNTEASTFWGSISLGRLLVYTICLFVFGYALYKLIKFKTLNTFVSVQGKKGLPADFMEEDIHEMNFDSLLKDALDNKQFRLAIRLVYLQSLKLLSDNDLIHWEPYKTNHDYSFEIKEQPVRHNFERLSFFFDYAWYGDFMVNERHYTIVSELLKDIKNRTTK